MERENLELQQANEVLKAAAGFFARELNPRLKIGGIVLTLFDPRTTLALQVAEQVRAQFPEKTFRTVIPRNVRLSEAPSYGMPITQYDPTSRGGVAYQELTKELIAR